jgi:hypothetical protein
MTILCILDFYGLD